MAFDDTITTYLKGKLPDIDNASLALVESRTTFKTFKKDEIIIDYGSYSETTFILKSGYVANFSRLEDGSDFIRTLFYPPNEFGSLYCFITKKKTKMVFKAITDCEVYELNSGDLIFNKNQTVTKLYVKILEQTFLNFDKRISELAGLDATQRYLQLRKDIPYIDNILPQYQIANYLNVTPVQLSRIRRKMLK